MPDTFGHLRPQAGLRSRAAITPLSAATLLLLVSLVVSTSPAIRGGASVADLRPVGVRTVAAVEDRTDDDPSGAEASSSQPKSAAVMGGFVALALDEARASRWDERSIALPARVNLVRAALLGLPPPRA